MVEALHLTVQYLASRIMMEAEYIFVPDQIAAFIMRLSAPIPQMAKKGKNSAPMLDMSESIFDNARLATKRARSSAG
jgi:hypothetical protein